MFGQLPENQTHEAYAYVENIRKYQISLVGYLLEKEKEDRKSTRLNSSHT